MAADETSQDSAVIGDELVEALGFEPVGDAADLGSAVPTNDVHADEFVADDANHGDIAGGETGDPSSLEGAGESIADSTVDEQQDETVEDAEEPEEAMSQELSDDTAAVDDGVSVDGVAADDAAVVDDISLTGDEAVAPDDRSAGDEVLVIDLSEPTIETEDLETEIPGTPEQQSEVPEAEAGSSENSAPETAEPAPETPFALVDWAESDDGEARAAPESTLVVPVPAEAPFTPEGRSPEAAPHEPPPPEQNAPILSRVPTIGARRHRLRAKKSRRVVRHIDPWSVLTFSVLFHLCFFAAMLLASVLVWNAAIAAGTIENIENFIRELGDYETFEINSDQVFQAAVLIAGLLTLASTVLVVLLTVVFNLISDLVGGIRLTVIEEETVRLPPSDDQQDSM